MEDERLVIDDLDQLGQVRLVDPDVDETAESQNNASERDEVTPRS